MRRVLAVTLVAAIAFPVSPLVAARRQAQGAASISGTATSAGRTVANTTVQLRNLATGQLAGTTTTNAAGQFSFVGLNAGNYAVEVVNTAGQIIGTSGSIAVSAGATVTGITVASTAAVAGAAAGGAAAGAAAAGGAAAGLSTAAIVGIVAAGAGVATVVAVKQSGSSSQ